MVLAKQVQAFEVLIMIRLIERDVGYVVFFYKDYDDRPVNYKKVPEATSVKEALSTVGRLMFSSLDGKEGKKVRKFHELEVSYILVTDMLMGRILLDMPIEEFIEKYGTKEVLDAWQNNFEDIE